MKRHIGIFILCGLTILPSLSARAATAGDKSGGRIKIGAFGINEPTSTLPRIRLYDYFSPSNTTLDLHLWTDLHPGRHDELTITNPGDQDHEIVFHSLSDAWRLDLSENRIHHSLTPSASTRRENDAFSFRYVQPGDMRFALTMKTGKRSGNLSASQPVGQTDRYGALMLQTPAGSVSASFSASRAGLNNGADNRDSSGYAGVLSYNPGQPLSAVVSMKTGRLSSRMGDDAIPDIRNDAVAVDVSLKMNRLYTLTANARFDDTKAFTTDALSTDDTVLGLGIHGGPAGSKWNLAYRFIDRSMSGIQTTDQEINRFEAGLRIKPAWPRNARVRVGARFENRDVSSTLQPSLKAFPELGSETFEAWLNASAPAFRKGGSASLFFRNKSRDFTLAPGVNRGTTGLDSSSYGLNALYPMGKTSLTYMYYFGKNETTFMMDIAGAAYEAAPANDQNTHTIALSWPCGADTDVDVSAMLGTGHSGGLFEAGRTRETDARVTITRRLGGNRTGSLTLRANNFKDDLSPSLDEKSLYIEAALTRSF